MRVVIVGYYCYADGVKAAGESLEKEGWEVTHFPLMEKISGDAWDEDLIDLLHPTKGVSVVLWWYPIHQIPYQKVLNVVDSAAAFQRHFYFNWDPSYLPYQTENSEEVSQKKEKVYPLMDLVISANPLEASAFSNAVHCPPGFSSSYHYPEENSEYSCDISFVGTNLYEDEEMWPARFQLYNRGALLDLIYESGLDLKVYGPPWLKERFPNAYVSSIPYHQTHLVFSNSLINISVNCVSIDGYFSERVPQIIASRGVVYTDNHLGFGFIEGADYVLLDRRDPVGQIKTLLSDKSKLIQMRNSTSIKESNISWDRFKDIIVKYGAGSCCL